MTSSQSKSGRTYLWVSPGNASPWRDQLLFELLSVLTSRPVWLRMSCYLPSTLLWRLSWSCQFQYAEPYGTRSCRWGLPGVVAEGLQSSSNSICVWANPSSDSRCCSNKLSCTECTSAVRCSLTRKCCRPWRVVRKPPFFKLDDDFDWNINYTAVKTQG